ncbi:NucA/NucB deoxyribonuclease domain-containing protein [Dickeya chrysanthemi]|uniref:NucA/NucB deoxyribonuclease domain-containing protein n=1 Tax=Dickeya chrysanthemi TaxID=556 RepID=UPI0030191490
MGSLADFATDNVVVENNSLAGDNARQSVKESAEWWKKQVRDKLGEGTTSATANSIINAIADSGDSAIGSADYVADAAMALASCAAGDSYCNKALSDLSGKNQAVADSVSALMKSETWAAVADTIKQASGGNQAALEATGGMLAGILLPGKKAPALSEALTEPKVVIVDKAKYPESARHIEDAQQAGHPTVLTIDRGGASERRKESLKDTPTVPGLDRDEYPPAMFKEGGSGASVRLITPSDNRGAGACIGAQCRGLPDGSSVIIKTEKEK